MKSIDVEGTERRPSRGMAARAPHIQVGEGTLEVEIGSRAVELIARRVADLLQPELAPKARRRLVDAAALAEELGVERDWVYAHADQLGAVRLGGPRGRLRFDPDAVTESMTEGGRPPSIAPASSSTRPPRAAARKPSAQQLRSAGKQVAERRANAARPDTGR